ncbi:MAG: glycoside hydrolase family 43 protein [Acetatifactor sp.]
MQYNNPVLKGFYPDPSICRVGEDYYLVVSSFEYFPGIPIFHSKDLVNWKQIGNCIQRLEEFPLDGVEDSGGIWAPTIRYHAGCFYVTATLEQYGNFIIHTEDPAGEWSAPIWLSIQGIDPSLYFEDNYAYYCTNQSLHPGREEITLEEIDLQTGEMIGTQTVIWCGMGGGFLEAPHIYKIGDWYYLLTAEGGTSFNHMVTVARSRTLRGGYEGCPRNPILTNAHDTSKQVQCTGHGDLLQDHTGNWWMVHLGIRLSRRTMSHLGRETFLSPVRWEEGWPVVGDSGMARLTEEGPIWAEQNNSIGFCADFTKREWEPEWIFLRNPIRENYVRDGKELKLYPTSVTLAEGKSPTFAAVRQPDFECEVQTKFSFDARENGEEAGLAILLSHEFFYRFCKRRIGDKLVLVLDKTAEDFRETIEFCDLPEDADYLCLTVRADREKYHFYYCIGNGNRQYGVSASTRFLACEVAGRTFTGTVIGIYATCQRESSGVMSVAEFQVSKF